MFVGFIYATIVCISRVFSFEPRAYCLSTHMTASKSSVEFFYIRSYLNRRLVGLNKL